MNIVVLGAGVAASHYKKGSDTNIYPPGFLVQWGEGEQLLFECSEGVRFRLEKMGIDYASIEHVAVSHAHPDHYAPLHLVQSLYCKGLWSDTGYGTQSFTLYGPDELIADFPTLWNIHLPQKEGYYPGFDLGLVPLSDGISRQIGTASLQAAPVYHGFGKCPAVAYRLQTPEGIVAYSGDTGMCAGITTIAKGADIFICEASAKVGDTTSATEYGHLDPATVGNIAKDAGVKTLLLFHYTGLDTDDAIRASVREAGFRGELILGKDLTRLSFA